MLAAAATSLAFAYEAEQEYPPPLDDDDGPIPARHAFYASPDRGAPLCTIMSCGDASWSSTPTPSGSMHAACAWAAEA